MNQLTPRGPLGQKVPKQRFTPLERRYYAWLHERCTCCVTAQPIFEIAHTGKKHMSMKSPLNTLMPLIRPLHMIEEKQRVTFWNTVGLPDYERQAKKLYKAFIEGDDPEMLLQAMHSDIDRGYVATLLGEIDF